MGADIPHVAEETIGGVIEAISNFPGFTESDLDLIARGNATRLYPELAKRL
jgi:hypothetical protein